MVCNNRRRVFDYDRQCNLYLYSKRRCGVVLLHVNCWDSVIRVSPTLYLSVYCHYKVAVPISKSMNLGPSRVTLCERITCSLRQIPSLHYSCQNIKLFLNLEPHSEMEAEENETYLCKFEHIFTYVRMGNEDS